MPSGKGDVRPRLVRGVGAAALVACLWPALAHAAGGAASPGPGGGDLGTVMFLVLMVAVLYLAAHFAVDWLQHRFLVVSGLEYIVLGILLGPLVLGAVEDLTGLAPIIALAASWVGLMRGADCTGRHLREAEPGTARIVFVHHLVPGALVGLSAFTLFLKAGIVPPRHWTEAAISAAVLGCAAAADSVEPFDLLGRRYALGKKLAPMLRTATRFGDFVVILAFGVIFCVFHRHSAGIEHVVEGSKWAWVTLGLGFGLGLLLTPFLGNDDSPNTRFLALVGVITFAAGASYYLHLSSLTVNLLLGMVLANFRKDGAAIYDTLTRTERPLSLVLLVFAGALWRPTEPVATLAGLAAFVVARDVAKVIASRIAAMGTPLRKDLFKGLLAHGDVTVSMAVSFRLVYDGPAVDLAYGIILASVVLHDLVAPRVLRSLLVDVGDVRKELTELPSTAGTN